MERGVSSADRRVVARVIELGRMIARAATPEAVLQTLVDVGVREMGAPAAAALSLDPQTGVVRLVAAAGSIEIAPLTVDEDAVGDEIGDAVRRAYSTFRSAATWPLVSDGGVFGYVVLLYEDASPRASVVPDLPWDDLLSMGAIALERAAQHAQLAHSYAELRASREALARTEKLRALGQMAAGVAHDLRNIINPCHLHLQFLKRTLPKDATEALQTVAEMQGVLKRGLDTITRLRDFSRQAPAKSNERMDLDHLCREAISITHARLFAKHDVHFEVVQKLTGPYPVVIDGSGAIAAIVNLIVNAADAMPKGGKIEVSTFGDAQSASIRVADDGPGMPAEVADRVFEPFFTTKGDDGTGLGLAMVYAFVQRHGGHVSLDTAPGKGASFTLTFPRS